MKVGMIDTGRRCRPNAYWHCVSVCLSACLAWHIYVVASAPSVCRPPAPPLLGKSKQVKLFNLHFRNRPSLRVLWLCTRTSERPSDGRDGCCPAAYLALFILVASSSPSLAADPGSQHSLARLFFSRLSSANEAILGFEDEREGLS